MTLCASAVMSYIRFCCRKVEGNHSMRDPTNQALTPVPIEEFSLDGKRRHHKPVHRPSYHKADWLTRVKANLIGRMVIPDKPKGET